MRNIYNRELGSYLNNAVGYIVIVLFAVLANFLFLRDAFVTGSVSLKAFFAIIPWLFLVFIPALVMRSFSEERRTNTIEILLTLPVTEASIVIAKFLAFLTLSAIALALTASIPVTFYFLSRVYIPEILVGYLGSLLLAASYISISLFFSNATKNQIVAFLMSAVTIFLLVGITSDLFTSLLPKFIQDFIGIFGPVFHFGNFLKGVVDLRSLFYFGSLTALFLFLTVVQLEKRD